MIIKQHTTVLCDLWWYYQKEKNATKSKLELNIMSMAATAHSQHIRLSAMYFQLSRLQIALKHELAVSLRRKESFDGYR